MAKLKYAKLFMAKINYNIFIMPKLNYVKLNHGLNIHCKFLNFICQIYLNICFGK